MTAVLEVKKKIPAWALVVAAAIALPLVPAWTQSKAAAGDVLIERARAQRTSATDLEVVGDLRGLPSGATRYLTREALLALPQVTYTVSDDVNFKGATRIRGVLLEDLIRALAGNPSADLAVAICDDQYQAHYPRAYLAEHHPVLVLEVNGHPPERWPKSPEAHGEYMGPYMISHREFKPSFRILAHQDESQIPWGVIRLELDNEEHFFRPIVPRGPHASDDAVRAGYRIAQQNCLRCHSAGSAGGQKAGRPWLVLAALATASPKYFGGYVRNPQAENPHAQMYANPDYDDATLKALTAYFQTFSSAEKP